MRKLLRVIQIIAIILVAGYFVTRHLSLDQNEIEGRWQAVMADGTELEIQVDKEKITFEKLGQKQSMKYAHVNSGLNDDWTYYQLDIDGEDYSFIYPSSNRKEAVLIELEDPKEPTLGNAVFVLNREAIPHYQEFLDKHNEMTQ